MEVGRTGEAGFFVNSEEAFERAMLQGVVGKDSHGGGNADAIVGTKGGTVADEPTVFDVGLDGLGKKIEFFIAVFFANHVHVGLEAHAGGIFIARGGGFTD